MSGDPVAALQSVLRAEHAAVYGYGALGAHLGLAEQPVATEADQAHRARRDTVAGLLVARSEGPEPALPAYAVPTPLATPADARRIAVGIEERTAAAWRAAVPELADADRRVAIAALSDCAVRAARWRRVLAPKGPSTVAFPGT